MGIDWNLHWNDNKTVSKKRGSACFSQFFSTSRCFDSEWHGKQLRPSHIKFMPRVWHDLKDDDVAKYATLLSELAAFKPWCKLAIEDGKVTVTVDCAAPIYIFGGILYMYRHIQEQHNVIPAVVAALSGGADEAAALLIGGRYSKQQNGGSHTLAMPGDWDRATRIYHWLKTGDRSLLKEGVGEPMNTGVTIQGSGLFWAGTTYGQLDGSFKRECEHTCHPDKIYSRLQELEHEAINRRSCTAVCKAVQCAGIGCADDQRPVASGAVPA